MIVITLSDDVSTYRVHRVDEKTRASVDVTEEFELHQLCCKSGDRLLGGVFLGRDVTDSVKEPPTNAVSIQCPSSSESTSQG